MAVYTLNDTPGAIAPYSPHQIVFGRDPVGPFEVPSLSIPKMSVHAEDWFARMQRIWHTVKDKLTARHAALTDKFNKVHKTVNYATGDSVWVKRQTKDVDSKLDPLYLGPCEILEVVRPNRYVVSLPEGAVELNAEELKPYHLEKGKKGVP